MKVMIGEYELLESMTIIQIDGKDISFDIKDDIEGDMHFQVSFINDSENKDGYTQVVAIDKFNAKILIANTSYGANSSIIRLGTYQYEYNLFLNFRIVNVIDNSRTIILNLYFKKKEG